MLSCTDLKKQLEEKYKLVCFEDLAKISNSYEFVYELLYGCHKAVFDTDERLVFYSKFVPDVDLLTHLQIALRDVDISNWFVLLVCPGDIKLDLDNVRIHHSYDECSISQRSTTVVDGQILSPKSKYTRSNTLCPLPWSNIAVNANGELTPCCVFNSSSFDKKYNINQHSLDDFYHSDELTSVRKQLTNGKIPQGCQSCFNKEKSGYITPRTSSNLVYSRHFKTKSLEDQSLQRIINLDIDLGNLCNLKCRICNWQKSSSIAAELVTKRNFHDVKIIKKWNEESKWITHLDAWNKFNPVIDNLVNLEFEGGEPFFYDWQSPLINHLCDTNKSKDVRLRYSTNATIFPTEQIQYWHKFRKIQLELSVDDIGPRIEYQRDGTNWQILEENLKKYQALQLELTNLDISFFVTVSLQNIFYLPELVTYCTQFEWPIHLSLLYYPQWLSVFNLNATAREMVLYKFQKFSQTNPDLFSIISKVQQTVNNMLPGDPTQSIEELKKLDAIRGQSFLDAHSEIATALNY